MLYYTDLEKIVLDIPTDVSTDAFAIISGYVGIEPIRQLKELPADVRATVIYGMYGSDNISAPLHDALVKIQ